MTDISHMLTKLLDNDPGVCESDDGERKTKQQQHPPEITDKASVDAVSAADEIRYYKCNFIMKNQNADVHLMQQLGELLMMII